MQSLICQPNKQIHVIIIFIETISLTAIRHVMYIYISGLSGRGCNFSTFIILIQLYSNAYSYYIRIVSIVILQHNYVL